MRLGPGLLALALLLALLGCGGESEKALSPSEGPIGKGASGIWIYRPAGTPKDLVIYLHGQGGPTEATPENHLPWITHLVSRGSIVLYPRYEMDYEAEPMQFIANGIRTAAKRVDLDGLPVLVIGYSRGGGLAVEYGAVAGEEDLPVPDAILGVLPAGFGNANSSSRPHTALAFDGDSVPRRRPRHCRGEPGRGLHGQASRVCRVPRRERPRRACGVKGALRGGSRRADANLAGRARRLLGPGRPDPGRARRGLGGDRRQLAAEPDEERLQREAGLELQLLEEPPRLPNGFGRGLCAPKLLDARVLPQLGEPVDVRRRRLGSGRDDDEVPVPGLELLEAEEHLLALGAAHRPTRALLLLARGQVELLVLGLRPLLRLVGTLGRDSHQRVRGLARLEPRIPVDRARDLEHRFAPPGRLRVEQPVDAVEPPTRNAGERRRLLLRQLRSPRG